MSSSQEALESFVSDFGDRQGKVVNASHPSLKIEDVYDMGKVLGTGASPKIKVFLGVHRATGEEVAIKSIPKSILTSTCRANSLLACTPHQRRSLLFALTNQQ